MPSEMFKNIQVNGEEPLIEDITREFNRGMWTIGYTGQSPERLKEHQQNWQPSTTPALKAEGWTGRRRVTTVCPGRAGERRK